MTDPDNLPEPQAHLLAKLFHLTPAESEVAVALASGKSIEDLSTELSISRNTARCHVQKIFQKTGVKRQGS